METQALTAICLAARLAWWWIRRQAHPTTNVAGDPRQVVIHIESNQPTKVLTEIKVHLRPRFSDVHICIGQRQRRSKSPSQKG